jgi:hypothetical protein
MVTLLFLAGSVLLVSNSSSEASGEKKKRKQEAVKIEVTQRGPNQADYDRAKVHVAQHPDVKRLLDGTHNKMLAFHIIDPDNKGARTDVPPSRYRAVFYDYTNNRQVTAEGNFDLTGSVEVNTEFYQPPVDEEELNAAIEILKRDAYFGALLREGKVMPYPPMPPVLNHKSSERVERVVNVGLEPTKGNESLHEIVGVNMGRGTIMRFESKAPPSARADSTDGCGYPSSGGSNGRNLAGSYNLTVSQSGTQLWSMTVNRPSSSSGRDGSGIELSNVMYRGKMVLKRAHIPILNVQYVSSCGPFRDWQYSETSFKTDNSPEVAPGIKISTTPALTIVDDFNDSGNFRGVAIYTQGQETVLVTELSAGWYRYINEWRFHNDGTIRPRYGFGSTANSCVCIQRNHHVYWRLDFDLNGTNNSVSRIYYQQHLQKQFNPIETEVKQYRNAPQEHWLITNPSTGDRWLISPNNKDGTALNDTYGKGDFWLLRYKTFPTEVDDGAVYTGSSANLDAFVNSEAVNDQDIVIWYGGHATRSDDTSLVGTNNILSGQFVIGPDIRPIRW